MLETARLELHSVGDKASHIDDMIALWNHPRVQRSYEGGLSLRDKEKLRETVRIYSSFKASPR